MPASAAVTDHGGDGVSGATRGVRTSVWWDTESCGVPRGYDPHSIAGNISAALARAGYHGPIASFTAYGDPSRLPNHVLHALSSTAIALNFVPSGTKDTSEKRILVDMLFWAIDNPAPANYLLISGDRDFSNVLNQLSMRRYNILLAKPPYGCQEMTAVAKCVWSYTSLLQGGPPLKCSPHPGSPLNSSISNLESCKGYPPDSYDTGRTGSRQNGSQASHQLTPYIQRHSSSESRASSYEGLVPPTNGYQGIVSSKGHDSIQQPHHVNGPHSGSMNSSSIVKLSPQKNSEMKNFFGAPHELFSTNISNPLGGPVSDDVPPHSEFTVSGSHGNTTPSPPPQCNSCLQVDVHNLDRKLQYATNSVQDDFNSSLASDPVGAVLRALHILKSNKIAPTGENISDCICYGEMNLQNFNIKKTLDQAIEQQEITMLKLGGKIPFYIGSKDTLWKCVNIIDITATYPQGVWYAVLEFLHSADGCSTILASRCRYEAAVMLKKSCLSNLVLGQVLQILNLMFHVKKWIVPNHSSGWQPLSLCLPETDTIDESANEVASSDT